jgi:hypothetical protein
MHKFQKIAIVLAVFVALLGVGISQASVSNELRNMSQNFEGGSSAADEAIAKFESQSAWDSNIYQQQVTALWTVKDLLKVLADQAGASGDIGTAIVATNMAQLNAQNTTNWLLVLLLVALATFGLTQVRTLPRKVRGDDGPEEQKVGDESLSYKEWKEIRRSHKGVK